jgi:hypothetical protein
MFMVKPPCWRRINHSHPLAKGLVGYWIFNENTGNKVSDLSGQDNNGTINGALWVPGKDGPALSFSGIGDYIVIGDDASLRLGTGDLTFASWLNASSAPVSTYPVILSKGTYNTDGGFLLYIVSGVIKCYLDAKGVLGATSVDDDCWHHVVVTKNGNDLTLYVDAEVDGIDIHTDININSTLNIGVGARKLPTPEQYFKGLISNISIYSRALSAEEVAWLYREPYAIYRS